MQSKVAGALLVALALALVACGEASKPLAAGQLRAQASAVCRDTTRRISAMRTTMTQATAHAFMRRASVATGDGVARLQALQPPSRLAGPYRRLVALLAARRDALKALGGPRPALTALERDVVSTHHDPIGATARRLGIDGCV